ncbi:MAG: TonB-dependent receptor, partial [Woeseia sp.]|nr:TonB-dependent receptor [Woeseia sp.]
AELPPSIAVLDQATIEQSAVQHFEELVFSVPNLSYSGDGHRARYFQIRGIGELEQYEGAPNPSVGFLIDGIDFSGIATVATLFDVEQVDVLRGPQGTRYGANALAGLIYVQSAAPTAEWGGRMQLTAGSDDALAGGIAFGGPLVEDTLNFRVAAHHHESNGFRDNTFLNREDTNGRRESLLRGRLNWNAGNDWQLGLTTMVADIDDGYDAFAIDNSLTMQSDKPGRDAQESAAGSLRASWNGSEGMSFTSITTYADSDIDFSFDADWGNEEVWAPYTYDFVSLSSRKRRTLSQELRLTSAEAGRLFNDSTDWLFGVYVMRLNDELTTINRGDYVDPFFNFALAIDDRFGGDFEALNAAVFGELDIDIGERGVLSIGLRAERRTTDYTDTAGLVLDPAESMFGGELRYRYAINGNVSAFAALSRGYKAGGFNLGAVPTGRREFAQEALWNFETGVRSTWLDGNLSVNGLVFFNTRRDQQVRTSFQLVPNDPASFVFFTDNAASGRSLGLEAEVTYRSSEALSWHLSAGLLYAEFDDFRTPQVDLSGRDQAHAPRYTLSAGVEWRAPAGYFARLDVLARDDFYFDVSHDQRSQPYELVNARAGYDAERWQLQLWARNLLDERYAVRGFYFGNEPPDFPETLYVRQGDPRQIGLTFDMRF